ncbi:MAG: ABC transporter permease [Planctomycetes bacterium]|nr:ABC transporter permease [Planctomycetota bacterium]MCB9891736.1 ABC transporter permease [Planctomycetota bacterium]
MPTRSHVPRADAPFVVTLVGFCAVYVLLIVAMLAADVSFTSLDDLRDAWNDEHIRYALKLSLVSCTVSAIVSLWFAVPIGYLLSRFTFRGKTLLEAVLDIPIVLPPLVIGLSLLILFQTAPGRAVETLVPVTYRVPSVILAQFAVACAFAVRAMVVTFDRIPERTERVALTLGCNRAQAFWKVVLPQAGSGVLSAFLLAWARALGEFGPILVFSGATRMRTEVLPTSIFLELSIGRIERAVAVSFLLVTAALVVLVLARAPWARQVRRSDA